MEFVERFIVQDLETFEFICPDFVTGGLGQTPFLRAAGKYETRQDALQAGIDETGGQFSVFAFFEHVESE